mgnify:FL=1
MNYDIASELSGIYDLSRTIPTLTVYFIAASGIILLCFAIGLVIMTKKNVGLRFFPILYGITAYLLFYLMIGSFLSSLISTTIPDDISAANLAVMRLLVLIITSALVVGGRFFAMWFIRKYYNEYCDAYGIGVGVSLTEAVITGVTILFNYSLCTTLNANGLAALANSYDTVDEAVQQLSSLMFFYDNPSYTYMFSGIESLMLLVFNTMISVMFYAVYHGELKKIHILSIVGLQSLMYLPGNFYSAGILFNRIGCFTAEVLIFTGCTLLFLRIHNTWYRSIKPPVKETKNKPGSNQPKPSASKKMPDFNKNINK